MEQARGTHGQQIEAQRQQQAANVQPPQGEAELFARARRGDEEAQQALVRLHLRLVVRVAAEYDNSGLSLSDLVRQGRAGLLEAIRRYDEAPGFRFVTYAVWWVRQAILKALAAQQQAGRPVADADELPSATQQAGRLTRRLGRTPTYDELTAGIDMSAERAREALELRQAEGGPQAPSAAAAPLYTASRAAGGEELERVERSVRASLAMLDERERQALCGCAWLGIADPRSLVGIGGSLGIGGPRAGAPNRRGGRRGHPPVF